MMAGEASPAAVGAAWGLTLRRSKRVAAQKEVEASPATVDVGAPLARIKKKMAVPVAIQEVLETSPVVVVAGVPTARYKKMAVPVDAQKVDEASPQQWMLGCH